MSNREYKFFDEEIITLECDRCGKIFCKCRENDIEIFKKSGLSDDEAKTAADLIHGPEQPFVFFKGSGTF